MNGNPLTAFSFGVCESQYLFQREHLWQFNHATHKSYTCKVINAIAIKKKCQSIWVKKKEKCHKCLELSSPTLRIQDDCAKSMHGAFIVRFWAVASCKDWKQGQEIMNNPATCQTLMSQLKVVFELQADYDLKHHKTIQDYDWCKRITV